MSPKTEPMLTTLDGLAAANRGIRSRVSAIGAMTLVRNVLLIASSSNFSMAAPLTTPALLTSMSSAFHSPLMTSTIRRRSRGFVISAGMMRCWLTWPSSAAVPSRAVSRRPQSATTIPRCAASIAKARPIPEPAPVISTHFWSRDMVQLRASAEVVKDRAVQSVEDHCIVDNDALGFRVIEAVDKPSEKGDMFGIQRSVTPKIAKSGFALQAEGGLHSVCDLVSQQYGHPLENMHASEECIWADLLDSVIGVAHHDPAGGASLADANLILIAAERAYVLKNPFLVTALFRHVFDQSVLIAFIRSA